MFEGTGALRGIDTRWAGTQFATAGPTLDVWDPSRSVPLHSFSWGADSVLTVRFNPAEVSGARSFFPFSFCFASHRCV